jgi:hypothetical protein
MCHSDIKIGLFIIGFVFGITGVIYLQSRYS